MKKSLICSLMILTYFPALQATLGERLTFAKEFFKASDGAGTMIECSHAVGQELIKYLMQLQRDNPERSLRVLQLGAGTGSITEVIAQQLRTIDHLDAVEKSDSMCAILHQKFDDKPNVSIRCLSIIDWCPQETYDLIISMLPFTLFDVDMMSKVIEHLKKLIKPNGYISYVAYLGGSKLKKLFSWGNKKQEHEKKMSILKNFRHSYKIDKTIVWKNVPPIRVYHLQFSKA